MDYKKFKTFVEASKKLASMYNGKNVGVKVLIRPGAMQTRFYGPKQLNGYIYYQIDDVSINCTGTYDLSDFIAITATTYTSITIEQDMIFADTVEFPLEQVNDFDEWVDVIPGNPLFVPTFFYDIFHIIENNGSVWATSCILWDEHNNIIATDGFAMIVGQIPNNQKVSNKIIALLPKFPTTIFGKKLPKCFTIGNEDSVGCIAALNGATLAYIVETDKKYTIPVQDLVSGLENVENVVTYNSNLPLVSPNKDENWILILDGDMASVYKDLEKSPLASSKINGNVQRIAMSGRLFKSVINITGIPATLAYKNKNTPVFIQGKQGILGIVMPFNVDKD